MSNKFTTLKNYDWRKAASQVADDVEVEKAFMEQAYGFLSNKSKPLMQDPHRLGFEIVQKDDDNTKMVGIFAFKIDDELIYAPVFFLNGEIKGTDLLYRHTSKTFVPNNEGWITYLMERKKYDMGKTYDKDMTKKVPNDINFENIAYPPDYRGSGDYGYKSASIHNADEIWAGMKEAAVKSEEESLLKDFILQDGGLDSVEKIAHWIQENPESFGQQFAELSSLDNLAPEGLEEVIKDQEMQKIASSKPKENLILYVGKLPEEHKDKAESFFKRGFYLYEDREAKDLTPVYQDMESNLNSLKDPGLYKVLLADGSTVEAYSAPKHGAGSIGRSEGGATYIDTDYFYDTEKPIVNTVLVEKNGGRTISTSAQVFGEHVKSMSDILNDGDLLDSPSSGQAYRIYDTEAGAFTPAFRVISKTQKNGITSLEILCECDGSKKLLDINPDYKRVNLEDGVIGPEAKFVSVSTDKFESPEGQYSYGHFKPKGGLKPGGEASLMSWALDHGFRDLKLHHKEAQFSLQTSSSTQTAFMPKLSMIVKLAKEVGIHGDMAVDLVEKAEQEGTHKFIIEPMGLGEKAASAIHLLEQPEFTNNYDSEFGVTLENPQRFVLQTSENGVDIPQSRIGDAWDPGQGEGPQEETNSLPKGLLLSSNPADLGMLKDQMGVPNVFEHGIVGTLVNTYDSSSMIDKYLPNLEKGLDHLGRILFLFYWKPQDFEQAFGVDDMQNLEGKLISDFKSLGDTVLQLMKKTKGPQRDVVNFS